jgi:hypothetical protein
LPQRIPPVVGDDFGVRTVYRDHDWQPQVVLAPIDASGVPTGYSCVATIYMPRSYKFIALWRFLARRKVGEAGMSFWQAGDRFAHIVHVV